MEGLQAVVMSEDVVEWGGGEQQESVEGEVMTGIYS